MIYQKESLQNFGDAQFMDELIFSEFMTVGEESVGTTSLAFTPTTLTRMQNAFCDLNNDLAVAHCSSSGQPFSNGNQSDSSDFDDDDSSQDSNSMMANSRKRKMSSESITMTTNGAVEQKPPRKLPGPRPKRTLEEMTPIEAERRKRRRERNRNAATKCRQRRLEQTNELLNETEQLEQEALKLEREIANLRRQKNQLEFVLESHKSTCKAAVPLLIVPQAASAQAVKYEAKPAAPPVSTISHVNRPNSLPISLAVATSKNSMNSATTTDSFSMFSFDPITTMSGLTPMLSSVADLESPNAFILLSPTTLLA
jgi:hypothetical protein